MGLLDSVITAAIGAMGQPAPGQPSGSQRSEDQFSQIAAALTALLAPRPGAGQPGGSGQQAGPSGLDALIDKFKQNGLEDVINSWIGTGQNQAISPNDLGQALGQKTVNDLSRQAGTPQEDLLSQLSRVLPGVIDRLTPNGKLPSQADLGSGYRGR